MADQFGSLGAFDVDHMIGGEASRRGIDRSLAQRVVDRVTPQVVRDKVADLKTAHPDWPWADASEIMMPGQGTAMAGAAAGAIGLPVWAKMFGGSLKEALQGYHVPEEGLRGLPLTVSMALGDAWHDSKDIPGYLAKLVGGCYATDVAQNLAGWLGKQNATARFEDNLDGARPPLSYPDSDKVY